MLFPCCVILQKNCFETIANFLDIFFLSDDMEFEDNKILFYMFNFDFFYVKWKHRTLWRKLKAKCFQN